MTQSQIALRAVQLRRTCGRDAAMRYAMKRGVLRLYILALTLEAMHDFPTLCQYQAH